MSLSTIIIFLDTTNEPTNWYMDSDKDHELFQKDFLKATNKFMR